MKKKMLAVLLSSAMVLGLAACGQNGNNGQDLQNALQDAVQELEDALDTQVTEAPQAQDTAEEDLQAKYENFKIEDGLAAWGDDIYMSFESAMEVDGKTITMYIERAQKGNNRFSAMYTDTQDGSMYGTNLYNIDDVEYEYFFSNNDELEDALLTVDPEDENYAFSPMLVQTTGAVPTPDNAVATYESSEEIEGVYYDVVKVTGTTEEFDADANDYVTLEEIMTLFIERETGRIVSAEQQIDGKNTGKMRFTECTMNIELPDVEVSTVSKDVYNMYEAEYTMLMYYGPDYEYGSTEVSATDGDNLAPEMTKYDYVGAEYAYNEKFSIYFPDGFTYVENDGNSVNIATQNRDVIISFYTDVLDGTYTKDDYYEGYKASVKSFFGIPTDDWLTAESWNGKYIYAFGEYNGKVVETIVYVDDEHLVYIESMADGYSEYENAAELLLNGVYLY